MFVSPCIWQFLVRFSAAEEYAKFGFSGRRPYLLPYSQPAGFDSGYIQASVWWLFGRLFPHFLYVKEALGSSGASLGESRNSYFS